MKRFDRTLCLIGHCMLDMRLLEQQDLKRQSQTGELITPLHIHIPLKQLGRISPGYRFESGKHGDYSPQHRLRLRAHCKITGSGIGNRAFSAPMT
ncbi:MAG TPA: hypothetical protein VFF59_09860 [Anaerolineae bacterium]|nr:hypothetical protein [Anaerolineae bacterium]